LFFALENFQQYSSREIHWIQKNKTWCPHQGWLKPLAFRRSKVYDVLGQLAFRDSHESGIDVVIPAKVLRQTQDRELVERPESSVVDMTGFSGYRLSPV